MRSLWKTIAARWLGAEGSPGLAGDTLRDLLTVPDEITRPGFLLRRSAEVSRRAVMTQPTRPPRKAAAAAELAAARPAEPGQDRR